jgi:chemotaxis protein methyltransferase CheR
VTAAVADTDVERFRAIVVARLGLGFEDVKVGFLADVLRRRIETTEQDCETYLDSLESPGGTDGAAALPSELGALATELTIPETYFFRNIDQFHALSQRVLPERMKVRGVDRRLRILSAGCASGEEAYTIAIVLRDILEPGWDASVLAVDVNPSALQRARAGQFSAWSLRETPAQVQERWFTRVGRDVALTDQIKAAVTFEERNLAVDDWRLWARRHYDVIFCRNVMMYFTPENARALIARITDALAPGGFLFLGHAETLRGVTNDFHLCHTHQTFYYQLKSDGVSLWSEATSPDVGLSEQHEVREAVVLTSLAERSDSWVETIQAASERVQLLVDGHPSRAAFEAERPTSARPVRPSLTAALSLLRDEQFDEALALVDAIQANVIDDPDVLLLQAVLLTHAGALAQAENVCRRLVEIDELSAPAHYVLALCREGVGDLGGAIDEDRIAAYLDPNFAMPRLHLGLLARRVKDFGTARAEFSHAVTLLKDEDASRLLLFGGGFGRDALIALCRAEMRDRGTS